MIRCIKFWLIASMAAIFLLGCAGLTDKTKSGKSALSSINFSVPSFIAGGGETPEVTKEMKTRFSQANQAIQQQAFTQAVSILQGIIKESPALVAPRFNLASLYEEIAEPKKAEPIWKALAAEDLTNKEIQNRWALFLKNTGKYKEAEKVFMSALALNQGDPALHLNLGILYDVYLNEPKKALTYYLTYQILHEGQESEKVKLWILDLENRTASSS